MSTKAIYLIIGLFVAVLAGMLIFTNIVKNNTKDSLIEEPIDTDISIVKNLYGIDRIDAKHFYLDGVHTIVGSLVMPTPCDLLEGSAIVAESMPEQITFKFNVINNAETCPQVMTEQRFLIEAEASENASMRARFMGDEVELNLIPAGKNENPNDFEVFIKG